jgi:hypothetical protein
MMPPTIDLLRLVLIDVLQSDLHHQDPSICPVEERPQLRLLTKKSRAGQYLGTSSIQYLRCFFDTSPADRSSTFAPFLLLRSSATVIGVSTAGRQGWLLASSSCVDRAMQLLPDGTVINKAQKAKAEMRQQEPMTKG